MARIDINTGTNPNDGTGTPWRTAWQAVNSMFIEVYNLIAAAATSAQLTTEQEARIAADTAMADAIMLKASASSVASKAESTSVIRKDTAQTNTTDEKLQHAINSGLFESLVYQLFEPDEVVTVGTFVLPPLPRNFHIHDVYLVFNDADGTTTVSGDITTNEAGTLLAWSSAPLVGTNAPKQLAPTTYTNRSLPELHIPTFNLTVFDPAAYAAATLGLTLWIRGVWTS
jgi:hypothetical protein